MLRPCFAASGWDAGVLSATAGGDEVFCRQDKLDSVARVSKARTPRHEVKHRRHKYGTVQCTRGGTWRETANRLDRADSILR